MAPNKDRNQGSTGQNKTAASQDFRPLAPLGVTVKQLRDKRALLSTVEG